MMASVEAADANKANTEEAAEPASKMDKEKAEALKLEQLIKQGIESRYETTDPPVRPRVLDTPRMDEKEMGEEEKDVEEEEVGKKERNANWTQYEWIHHTQSVVKSADHFWVGGKRNNMHWVHWEGRNRCNKVQ